MKIFMTDENRDRLIRAGIIADDNGDIRARGKAMRHVDEHGNLTAEGVKEMFDAVDRAAEERFDRELRREREKARERCPICGGLNPGDASHTRCQ